MLSDVCNGTLITAVLDSKCVDIALFKWLIRKKFPCKDVVVDLFSSGNETLLIAYPTPPKAIGATPMQPRRRHKKY